MEVKNYFATDAQGNVLGSAQVYLYLAGTTTLAPGLQSVSGAALANPFTSQQNGLVQFRAPDNNYDLRVVKPGREFTIRIQCFDGIAFIESLPGRISSSEKVGGVYQFSEFQVIQNGILKKANISQVAETASLRRFGAIGDGSSHPLSERFASLEDARAIYPRATSLNDEIDWCATWAAIDSDIKVIQPGSGKFFMGSSGGHLVKNKDKAFYGSGGQMTEFVYAGQGDGLRFEQNNAYDSHCIGVFVSTTTLNNGRGLSASYAGFQGIYERNKRYQVFAMNRVAGQDYFKSGWKINMELDEVTLPSAQQNTLIGRRDTSQPASSMAHWWPWTQYGLNYTSSTNLEPTDALFDDNLINYCEYGSNVKGTLEGVRFDRSITVACRWGANIDLRAVSGDPTINPWVSFSQCHMNCSAGGIVSTYCYEGFVDSCLLYKFDQVDEDYTGITLSFGNNWKISGNHVNGISGSVGKARFMSCRQNNDSKVHDNHGSYLDEGVLVDGTGGIAGVETYNNKFKGRDGKEIPQVIYANGADKLKNPATIQGGIVAEGSNQATVAIASGGVATVASFSLDDYPVGSIFRFYGNCQVLKGGTAGTTKLYLEKTAGTGNVAYMASATGVGVQNDSHAPGANWQAGLVVIVKKTVAGPVTVKFAVASGGSNASVAALDGQFVIERMA